MSITSKDAVHARQRLGLSVEDIAAEFGLTPHVVQEWERGSVRVPARVAKELQWRLALQDRNEALLASGLPECAWMVTWDNEEFPEDLDAQTAHMERAGEHLKSCSACKAREQFVVERFGEMPKRPMPGSVALLGWIATQAVQLPEWAQPAIWVGLAFGAYSMLRIIFWIPAMLREPRIAITALAGLGASVAIGASLGLAYGGFQVLRVKWARRSSLTRRAGVRNTS